MPEVLSRGRHHLRKIHPLNVVCDRSKKTCWIQQVFYWRCETRGGRSGYELITHDVGCYANALLLVEYGLPTGHFAKTVGDAVVHKFGLVRGGLELGRFARVGAVTVAMAALAIPHLFA